MYRAIIATFFVAVATSAVAHDMTPTYPEWYVSHIQGVVKTPMEIFNKRKDVEWYEIGVFDDAWEAVPFVISYKLVRLEYLDHGKFDLYLRREDVKRAKYVCSRSKIMGDAMLAPILSSRVCSRFK
jgi:hypothetical protein